jgi:pimeloyl-ACP methyl ester carboxylesterase
MKNLYSLFVILIIFQQCSSTRYTAKEAYQRLKNDNPNILNSEHFGNIEYKIHRGKGAPILIIHGLVGGYDQGMQTGQTLLPEDQTYLSISRFGYLASDLPDNPTPINQCKAFKEVLERNNIQNVFLLATSAGGTIAFKFALLYPEKVAGVILVGSGYPTDNKIPKGPPGFVYRDGIFQFMINHMQGNLLKMFGISKEEYLNADSTERKQLKILFHNLLPINPRRPGILNDVKITNPDVNINYSDYPLEEIKSPFLILHAKNDPMAKYSIMKTAVKRLSHVETKIYDKGGHLLFGHREANRKVIEKFINKYSR